MTDDRRVLVHSCHCKEKDRPASALVPEINYVSTAMGKAGSSEKWYHVLPKKCKCRKRVSYHEAQEYWEIGRAQAVVRYKTEGIVDTMDRSYGGTRMIWMPIVRTQTPRVDLITLADIERAYIDKLDKYVDYIEQVHQIYLDSRSLMFYGVVLEGGKYKSGSPTSILDPFEGRPLLINFGETPRPSKGRDVLPEEMKVIDERLKENILEAITDL